MDKKQVDGGDEARKVLFCYPMPKPKRGLVSPRDFLGWAKKDLMDNKDRAIGNALGNIKKAIHCRIDEIINSTHLVFAEDWNWFTIGTEEKIKIIQKLGVGGGAITRIITDDRNLYEHKYMLPHIDKVRAHLETAELWLDDSYNKRPFGRIGIFGLPVKDVKKCGDDIVEVLALAVYRKVSFFWDKKGLFLSTSGFFVQNREISGSTLKTLIIQAFENQN